MSATGRYTSTNGDLYFVKTFCIQIDHPWPLFNLIFVFSFNHTIIQQIHLVSNVRIRNRDFLMSLFLFFSQYEIQKPNLFF